MATIRSLARRGIAVIGADHQPVATHTRSRYLKQRISLPDDPELQVERLESLGREGDGVLISTSDYHIILIARNHARLAKVFTLTTPPWECLEQLMDKVRCYELARDLGLQTPDFFVPRSLEEMERVVDGLDFAQRRYVLKTRLWSSGPANPSNGRYTAFAGPGASSVKARFREIATRTGALPVIEQIVPGETDTCIGVSMVVGPDHEPRSCFCVKRIKLYPYERSGEVEHPYELGANTYCESTHDAEAVEAATRLVKATGYYGMITVEFRRDASDGVLKLIKTDPRPVRAMSLSGALGLDHPCSLYATFTGQPVEAVRDYRDGVAWLWVSSYLEAVVEHRDHAPLRRELLAVLRNATRIRAFGLLSLVDPMPFVALMWRVWWPRLKNRLRRPSARTKSALRAAA